MYQAPGIYYGIVALNDLERPVTNNGVWRCEYNVGVFSVVFFLNRPGGRTGPRRFP